MRTMTIQTQTPGGQDQPIPVKDAVEAVQWHLEVRSKATPGPWRVGEEPDSVDADSDFPVCCTYQPHMALAKANAVAIAAAGSGYAGALEYLLGELRADLIYHERYPELRLDVIEKGEPIYVAVAPIVAWWRQSGAHGGGK